MQASQRMLPKAALDAGPLNCPHSFFVACCDLALARLPSGGPGVGQELPFALTLHLGCAKKGGTLVIKRSLQSHSDFLHIQA